MSKVGQGGTSGSGGRQVSLGGEKKKWKGRGGWGMRTSEERSVDRGQGQVRELAKGYRLLLGTSSPLL